MKRLKNILRYEEVSGLLIYIPIAIIILYLSFLYVPIFILYTLYIFLLYRRHKVLFYYSLIISIFFGVLYIVYYLVYKCYQPVDEISGILIEKSDNYLIVKEGLHYLKIYSNKNDCFIIGKKITAKVSEYNIVSRNVENTFSYYKYKLTRKIICEYKLNSYTVDNKSFSIYLLKGKVISYIDNNFSENSISYLKKLVLGISSFDSELNDEISSLGIIALFSISGLHISILISIVKKTLRVINIPEEIISIITIVSLLLYMFITTSSVSIFRAIIMSFINEVLSIKDEKISKCDIISISFLITLLYNPFYIFQTGFYLTYLSTLIIYLSKEKNSVKLSIDIIVFTIPLLLYKNHEISLFVILFSISFTFLFSDVFIPLTYIVIIFSPLDYFYSILAGGLNDILYVLNDLNIMIDYSISNIYFLIFIYIGLFLFKMKRKNRKFQKIITYYLILINILNYGFSTYELIPSIEIIDVGQGDSFLLRSGFNVILIDTGEEDDYHTTVKYMKSLNIKRIDYCFITHTDSDHYSEYEYINSNLNVKNTIMNSNNEKYKIGAFDIETFHAINDDINESSMVLYVKVSNKTILFLADIESAGEEYMLNQDIKNVDFLKVPHHGSNTSSSEKLVNKLKPKVALISVGLNNSYGHPSSDVLERYEKIGSKIYRTDFDGSIKIKLFKYFSLIQTYRNDEIFFIDTLDNYSIIF